MTNPPPTPPDPALWTWTDTFERTFLGPDYVSHGATLIDGALRFGPMRRSMQQFAGSAEQSPLMPGVTLSPDIWTGPDIQAQFDWFYAWQSEAGDGYLQPGFQLTALASPSGQDGQRRVLRFVNGLLLEGRVQNGDNLNSLGTVAKFGWNPNTWQQIRLTIDTVQGRIQIQVDDQGLDVALPADFPSEFAGGAELQVIAQQLTSYSAEPFITVWVDNLAIRSGDGTADLSTGTANSSGGVRLGGEWRFAPGPPDDAVGSEGDVWCDSSTGTLSHKQGGTYVDVMQLLGAPGPQGEQGPQGPQGIQGPAGRDGVDGQPGELVGAVAVPLLLGDATPDGGLLIPLSPGPGSLIGYELLGVDGPAVVVEHASDGSTWVPVAFPFVLPAGVLRLTRTDDSGAVAVLRARSQPVAGGGSSPGFTVQTDGDGFDTYQEAQTSIDPDGYLTVTNATATTDPEGYVTLERTS